MRGKRFFASGDDGGDKWSDTAKLSSNSDARTHTHCFFRFLLSGTFVTFTYLDLNVSDIIQ